MNTDDLRKQAEGILEGSKDKAAAFLEDGGKMDQLLDQVEEKLATVPKAGVYLAEVPRMIALLKDYIQKDYTEVPKKSLIFIVAALLYLVNPKDIIPDKFLGVGLIDDAAVVAACIALTRADLDAYDAWKDAKA
ncbi:MAG: YkvA family protein [Bacillota bacterium]